MIEQTTSRRRRKKTKKSPDSDNKEGDEDNELVTLPCDTDGPLCALAFKVVHSPQGPLTMVRVYSGSLQSGDMIYNISHALRTAEEDAQRASRGGKKNRKKAANAASRSVERAHRVLEIDAAAMNEVRARQCILTANVRTSTHVSSVALLIQIPAVAAGNIAAIHGLQSIQSGDTLIAGDAARVPKKKAKSAQHQQFVLPGFDIPPAVFALSVEVRRYAWIVLRFECESEGLTQVLLCFLPGRPSRRRKKQS